MKRWMIVAVLVVVFLLASYTLLGAPLLISDITDELPKAGEYGKRDLSKIKYLVIHHSASENQSPLDYANFHIEKGWPGIGYHFVIQPSGKIWQTNHLETVSYHVQGYNTLSLGICLSGDLNEREMTTAQRRALKALLHKLQRELPQALEIKAHSDFVNTDCPGHLTDIENFQSALS